MSRTCRKCKTKYDELPGNFWKLQDHKGGRNGYDRTCSHCRNERKNKYYQPTITKDWPTDENGRWLNYWHIIDKNIILKE